MRNRIFSVIIFCMLVMPVFSSQVLGQEYITVNEGYPVTWETPAYVSGYGYEPVVMPIEETPPPQLPPAKAEKKPVVDVNSGWVGEADVDDDRGSFSFNHLEASLSYSYFNLSYTRHMYHWNDVGRLPFGNGIDDPWESLHRLGLSAHYRDAINQRWAYFVNGGLSFGYESALDRPELRFMGGLSYAWSPKLRLQMGGVVLNHGVRTLVLPVVGVRFGGGLGPGQPGWSGAIGFPETQVTYRFDPQLALKLAGFVDSRVYNLEDNSTVAPGGYLETRDFAGGVFLLYSPIKNMDVSVGGGYIFARDFLVYDEDGHERGDYDIDLAPLVRLGLKYRF